MAESQICRNKTLVQSVFRWLQYLLPGQKSDKGYGTEGRKFFVAGSKEAFFFCVGMAGCVPRKVGCTKGQRCDQRFQ